jgi:NADPH:quinone reductase-like Zn-dependent oxidoreductase
MAQPNGLQLRSTVKKEGTLELTLVNTSTPDPKPFEVVVLVDASPINPSDLGRLLGAAERCTAKASGTPANPAITASIAPNVMRMMAGRIDQSLPVGNEGAGVVVAAGRRKRHRSSSAKPSRFSAVRCIRSTA